MRYLVCYCLGGTDVLDETLVGQGWDGGADISRRRNGARAPPLDLEGPQAVVSGVGHQLIWFCNDVECLCWSSRIIQIDCTQIGTNR